MAKRIVWSKKASEERFEILNFWVSKTGSKKYSRKLEAKLRETIRNVSDNNYLGKATDIEGVRLSVVSNYLIFYEIKSEHIEILTIFDSRRDRSDIKLK